MGLFSSSADKQTKTFLKGMQAYRNSNYPRCRELWQPLANSGHVRAQAGLAHLYANGLGLDKDPALAFSWTLKAAEQGLAQSQNNLGWYYEHGLGVERDLDAALHWYRQAAEQGDSVAQTNLGFFHAHTADGDGQTAGHSNGEHEQALLWFRRAAGLGNHQAQKALADAYEFGHLGLSRNRDKADYWHQRAQR